jgi:hypothetical protein
MTGFLIFVFEYHLLTESLNLAILMSLIPCCRFPQRLALRGRDDAG